MTGADEFGRDGAGRPSFEGEYPAAPAYDDMPTTEFSRLVFDDDGELAGGLGAAPDRRGLANPLTGTPLTGSLGGGGPLGGPPNPGPGRLPNIPGLSANPLGGSLHSNDPLGRGPGGGQGSSNPFGNEHGQDPRGGPGSSHQFGDDQGHDPRSSGSHYPFGDETGPGDASGDQFGPPDRSQPSGPQGFPPAGGPPPPIRPRIPGIDGPAVPPGVYRDPPPFQAPGEGGYQRPVMPPIPPPSGRNPLEPPSPSQPRPPQGFGVPPQRDTNADSGPPRRPEPGARERQVLREAQQFDVFRREPVVPPQAPPIPDDLIVDGDPHPDNAAQSGWNQGPIDISVYDQATAQPPATGPGRDLGFPPMRSADPLSGSGVFADYDDPQYDDGLGFDVPETGDPRFDAAQRFEAQFEANQFEQPQFEQSQFDQAQFDQPQFGQRFEPQPPPHPLDTSQQFEPNQFGAPEADQLFDAPQAAEMPQFEPQQQPQPIPQQPQQPPQFAAAPPVTFAGAHFDPPQQFPAAEPAPAVELEDEDEEPVFVAPLAAPDAQPIPVFVVGDRDEAAEAAADPADPSDAEPEMLVPWDTPAADVPRVPPYDDAELAAVHRVIRERRDVRSTFLSDPIPDEVLTRVLEAAHTAPSVGFSQPWDFLVLRSAETREAVHGIAVRQRDAYAASLPKARARAFKELKIEAILDTPVNIVVTCDPTRGGRHTLGRYTQPQMAPYSSALAVENLWLAARAEGLGVGWVSFFDERELIRTLDLPEHLTVVAYLCVGYVREFPDEPELSGAGWAKRRPLAWAVHDEQYGRRALPGSAPVSLLDETLAAIAPLDEEALAEARARQARMTKPPGSLGVLEDVSVQLAGLAGVCPPPLPEPAAVAIFAADHGVHAQGVTPWPQEVTAQMVANFLAGGAVVNAFAAQIGAEVCVIDVGVNAELPSANGLVPRKIRYGTADLAEGPAMTRAEAVAALEVGIETARDLVASGNRCLLTGDMGIANTTASAALIAAFTGASPTQVTGYGTGIDEQTYAHKVDVVRRALDLHRPDPADPLGVLAAVGGLEHAALAGFILGAASLRTPVVLDGVIAGAAALVAQALSPEATSACVAGHRSAESGHQLALEALGIVPLIDLELRLGEGSGAVLALPLVQASVRALRDVATFESAGVAERPEDADPGPTD